MATMMLTMIVALRSINTKNSIIEGNSKLMLCRTCQAALANTQSNGVHRLCLCRSDVGVGGEPRGKTTGEPDPRQLSLCIYVNVVCVYIYVHLYCCICVDCLCIYIYIYALICIHMWPLSQNEGCKGHHFGWFWRSR